MFGKTPVSALQEYCAKKGLTNPVYEIAESSEDGTKVFICMVEAVDEMAEGTGRSKKEAKHDAATNILKKLKFTHPDIEQIPQTEHETPPVSDAVADLRDLCLERDHPFPTFEIIQQDGPPEAPEFVVECRVATIKRYAKASTKKGAKQLAAKKLVEIIRSIPVDNDQTEVMTFSQATEEENAKQQKKVQTYREFIESGGTTPPGTLISDRHNFFKKFDKELKFKANQVLNNNYLSSKEKVNDLLKVLNIGHKTTQISAKSGTFTFIELKCEMDVVFAENGETIYEEILEYFNDMLT